MPMSAMCESASHGTEGDKATDPDSVLVGKRMKNGWKNSAPWVYTIDPDNIISPD
jgi:hypothetical protein